MFEKCFEKLETAAGRKIDAAERKKLREGYEAAYLQEAKAGDKTAIDSMQAAFNRMVEEADKAKALAQYRKDLNVLRLEGMKFDVEAIASRIGGNKLEAIDRMLMWHPDNKAGVRAVDKHGEAIYQSFSTELRKIADTLGSRAAGLLQRGDKVEVFTKQLYGEEIRASDYENLTAEDIAAVKQAADSWAQIAERLRVRANKAGAAIGKLESWAYPQKWDAWRVLQATKKMNKANPQDAYVAIMLPRMDRAKMVDDFGMPLDDESLTKLLREAYLTITTDGASKTKEGPQRGGSIANRGSQERVLHFKSAADYLEVQAMFGSEQLLSILDSHVRSASTQVAMLERGGPSFRANVEKLVEEAKAERARAQVDTSKDQKRIRMIEAELNVLTGTGSTVDNLARARVFQGIRNLQTIRLAGATIASLAGDPAQYRMQMILHAWDTNLPLQRRLGHVLNMQLKGTLDLSKAMVSSGYRDGVVNMGLAAEAMNQALYRAGEDMATSGWTNVLPSLVMRASVLGALTNARREGMRVLTMGAMADKLKYSYDALGEIDSKLIKGGGITADDWAIYQATKLDDRLGKPLLTPEAVMKAEGFSEAEKLRASENLAAFMLAEDKLNVLEPGMRQRAEKIAAMHSGQIRRGNYTHELFLNFMQFKSFPHAYMSNYFKRMQMFDGPLGKTAYMAGLITMATIGGAAVSQIWNILSGRDVESMDPRENPLFFGRALFRGGGLGFYGDYLQSDITWRGQFDIQGFFLGPAGGQIALFGGTTAMALQDAGDISVSTASGIEVDDEDREKKWSRQIDAHVRDIKGIMPTNLWYTRALTDRAIYNQIGEALRPGYIERMQDRAKSMMGVEYFWNPGDASDIRAPEIGGAIGD